MSFCSYHNKEFNIARVRVYFNSYSEMMIPTSLYEATVEDNRINQTESMGIFSAMEVSDVHRLMSQ